MEYFILLIGGLIVLYIVFNSLKNYLKKVSVCTRCHTVGVSETKTSGSFLIEVLLWLCFIVPGIIYSLWRLSSKKEVCQSCGAQDLVPADSPRGKSIIDNSNYQNDNNTVESPSDYQAAGAVNHKAWIVVMVVLVAVCVGVIWIAIVNV